jgi:hypothetical protein
MDDRTQFISVQVDDVDAVHAAAVKRGLQIAQSDTSPARSAWAAPPATH